MPAEPAVPQVAERLIDELVRDAAGNLCDPGDALPLPLSSRIPMMPFEREMDYLHWLASTLSGTGHVVELGCFLGGATAAIADGLSHANSPRFPVLVYNTFEAPIDGTVMSNCWLKAHGLAPGENFLTRYELLHTHRLHKLDLRALNLPEKVASQQETSLYPEQAPIELLCNSSAINWDIHLMMLRTFGRWLRPGAVLVQQNFMEPLMPWLPLHMWQLRNVFEPIDIVRGTSTVAFRCTADPAPMLDQLWSDPSFDDAGSRQEVWRQVRSYWSNYCGERAVSLFFGHEAAHAIATEDCGTSVDAAHVYDAWARSAGAVGWYVSPLWNAFVSGLPDRIASRSGDISSHASAACMLAAEAEIRAVQLLGRGVSGHIPSNQRKAVWHEQLSQLRDAGHTRIALFGAGSHTEWLLENRLDFPAVEIACVIDDSPCADSIHGIPIVMPTEVGALLEEVTAIVPSSDAYEAQIIARAQAQFDERKYLIPRVYSAQAKAESTPNELTAKTMPIPEDALVRTKCASLPASAPERAALGLAVDRPWIGAFAKRYAAPQWANGFVNALDSLFLWDLIEAARPRRVVEIGTASGVSTAVIAAALDHFCTEYDSTDELAQIHSFDISTHCYFDAAHSVGAAAAEVVPDLMDRVAIHPGATAVDACRLHYIGEIDLVFIDGDHRHPAPTLDLLAMIHALKPNAWVVLHDIELTAVGESIGRTDWNVITGAERLFARWPFEKVQPMNPNPALNNIGAIRIPQVQDEAIPFLIDLLLEPWETQDGPPQKLVSALERTRILPV